jgi:hypothetical protein
VNGLLTSAWKVCGNSANDDAPAASAAAYAPPPDCTIWTNSVCHSAVCAFTDSNSAPHVPNNRPIATDTSSAAAGKIRVVEGAAAAVASLTASPI